MTPIEITNLAPLEADQLARLEMHSVLNIFNVLRGELTVLGIFLMDDDEGLQDSLSRCDQLVSNLANSSAALADARAMPEHARAFRSDIDRALAMQAISAVNPEVQTSLRSLGEVLAVLQNRALELIKRAESPDKWEKVPIVSLRNNFVSVFSAMAQHSRGRYGIVYNPKIKGANDYYFDFTIESNVQDFMIMPAVFQDVTRDLMANARKYTPRGGNVTTRLVFDGSALRLNVKDSGRGIPASELREVVKFGRRGSNCEGTRTMGGGLGLTKAVWATLQFGGRFWIGSDLGVGTSIEIVVPAPPGLE